MAESFSVDASVLWEQSQRLLDHMDASRRDHSGHTDNIGDVAESWSGETKAALAQLAQEWADKRASLHGRIGRSATNMAVGSRTFSEQETLNQNRFTTTDGRAV